MKKPQIWRSHVRLTQEKIQEEVMKSPDFIQVFFIILFFFTIAASHTVVTRSSRVFFSGNNEVNTSCKVKDCAKSCHLDCAVSLLNEE